jgi:hypothetical protein
MESGFDPGALLGNSYALPCGPRVRLRLTQLRDAPAIRALWERGGLDPEDLEVARLVRFDPRTRVVICATALIGSSDTLVGVGAIGLDVNPQAEPDTLVVDAQLTDGLDQLLRRALVGRAGAIAGARAA